MTYHTLTLTTEELLALSSALTLSRITVMPEVYAKVDRAVAQATHYREWKPGSVVDYRKGTQ